MLKIIKDIMEDGRKQAISAMVWVVFALLATWLHLSQDAVRNRIMSFFTDPRNFPDILWIFAFIASIPLWQEFYRSRSREWAIKRGANIIFEDQSFLWVSNVIDAWRASTGLNATFSKNENHRRIRNSYINQKLHLIETETQNKHSEDPISYMQIEKKEFIRWYINTRELPVSSLWKKK